MRCKLHLLRSVSFVALHHINEIRTRAGDVKSFFTGREKSVTRGFLCNETTSFTLISVAKESSQNQKGKGGRGGGRRVGLVYHLGFCNGGRI